MKKHPLILEKFRILSLKSLSKILGGTVTGNNSQECDTDTNPYTAETTTSTTSDITTQGCNQANDTTGTAGSRTTTEPPTTLAGTGVTTGGGTTTTPPSQ